MTAPLMVANVHQITYDSQYFRFSIQCGTFLSFTKIVKLYYNGGKVHIVFFLDCPLGQRLETEAHVRHLMCKIYFTTYLSESRDGCKRMVLCEDRQNWSHYMFSYREKRCEAY